MGTWVLKSFIELTTEELYDILALRAEIFVVEQNCPYQDPDGKDKKAMHMYYKEGDTIISYVRILTAGVSYQEPSIGRFVVKASERRKGYGRVIFTRAIDYITTFWKADAIRISGQAYLRNFYESLGFVVQKDGYLEDGIPHFEMLRTTKKTS